jgi:transcriptional regulator with XRE-family HTH domain
MSSLRFLSQDVREPLARALREILRTARQGAALTQEQMARRIGMGTQTYGRFERGRMVPSIPTLLRLCQALCVSREAVPGLGCAEDRARAAAPSSPRRSPARRGGGRTRARRLAALPVYPGLNVLPLVLVRPGRPLALVVELGTPVGRGA